MREMIELNEAGCLEVIQNSVLEDTLSFRTCDEVLSGVDLVKFDNSEIFLLWIFQQQLSSIQRFTSMASSVTRL